LAKLAYERTDSKLPILKSLSTPSTPTITRTCSKTEARQERLLFPIPFSPI